MKLIRNAGLMAGLGAMGLCSMAFAQAPNLTSADRTFMDKMAQGNLAEIELGHVAEQKASNGYVKAFAQRMINDHTTLNNELKQKARTMGVSLPTTVNSSDMAQKQKLEGLSGNAFDKAYIDDMLSDHQTDVQEVQREAENATNPQVKEIAAKALPILEDHIRIAEYDAGRLGVGPVKGLNQPEHPQPVS